MVLELLRSPYVITQQPIIILNIVNVVSAYKPLYIDILKHSIKSNAKVFVSTLEAILVFRYFFAHIFSDSIVDLLMSKFHTMQA